MTRNFDSLDRISILLEREINIYVDALRALPESIRVLEHEFAPEPVYHTPYTARIKPFRGYNGKPLESFILELDFPMPVWNRHLKCSAILRLSKQTGKISAEYIRRRLEHAVNKCLQENMPE